MDDDEEEADPDPWNYSNAKALLVKDIKDRIVLSGMHASQVYVMRPEYSEFDYDCFAGYLYSLRITYDELQNLADIDAQALAHDLALGLRKNSKPYPIWQGSIAERLLKEDLDTGADLVMKPAELRDSRPAYGVYPLTVFRDHIHQELRARRERPYWMGRKKAKEDEKRQKEVDKAKKAKAKEKAKVAKEAEKAKKAAEKAKKKSAASRSK